MSGQFKFHGIITTFEMIMADCPELKKINWLCVVIDEAHRLKNRNCKLLEGLKLMNLVISFAHLRTIKHTQMFLSWDVCVMCHIISTALQTVQRVQV